MPTTTPQLGRYKLDPGTSTVTFLTRHLFGLGVVRGTFPLRSGTVDVTEPATDSRMRVELDTAGFRTGNPRRDASVRAMLDVARFPVMTYQDRKLTVRDVTVEVPLAVEEITVVPGGFLALATARVDRYAFGVSAYRGLAARFLDVTVEVTCLRS